MTETDTITELTFFSEPGIYEVETEGGPRYEVTIPESLIDVGSLIIDRVPGEPDDGDAVTRKIFDIEFQVGEKGKLVLEDSTDLDAPPKEVTTKEIKTIARVK